MSAEAELTPKEYGRVFILQPEAVETPALVEWTKKYIADEAEKFLGFLPWNLEITGPVLHDDKPLSEADFHQFGTFMHYDSYEQYLEEFEPMPYYVMKWHWVGIVPPNGEDGLAKA